MHDRDAFLDRVEEEEATARTLLDKLRLGVSIRDKDPAALASQLQVSVERFRSVEGLFQPTSIMGIDQAGLIDVIEDMLAAFPADVQERLAQNVFVCGGASAIGGFTARLEGELTAIRPPSAAISIRRAGDAHLDAWRGAAKLVRECPFGSGEATALPWITRQWYDEHGGERLAGHAFFTNAF